MFIEGQVIQNNVALQYKNGEESIHIPVGTDLTVLSIGILIMGSDEKIVIRFKEFQHVLWDVESKGEIIFNYQANGI